MQVTVFSLMTAVFWSSILTIALCILRKSFHFVEHFGLQSMILMYAFCITRILFPFEFPFTKVVPVHFFYNQFIQGFHKELFEINHQQILLIELAIIVWFSFTAFSLFVFAFKYKKYVTNISRYNIKADEKIQQVWEEIQRESACKKSINIFYNNQIASPIGIGLLRKKILLPKHSYTQEELYYILKHEYTHFANNDLLLKFLIQIYCCVFWWNPVVYLLKKDLEQVLEIKCDLTMCKTMSQKEKADYLNTILSQLKRNEGKSFPPLSESVSLLGKSPKSSIEERFIYVLKNKSRSRKEKLSQFTFLLLTLVVFIASYLFLPQSQFAPPLSEIETDNSTKSVNEGQNYIIKHPNGTYELVFPDGQNIIIDEQTVIDMQKQGIEIIQK